VNLRDEMWVALNEVLGQSISVQQLNKATTVASRVATRWGMEEKDLEAQKCEREHHKDAS
jgi:hypothetical protein